MALSTRCKQDVGFADQPQRAVRKHRQERGDDRAEIRVADVVGVRPLAQHAARRQTGARDLEELAGEQRRDAGHPRVRRLRDDHVVLLVAEQQVRAAVTDDEPRARVWQGAVVLGFEEP